MKRRTLQSGFTLLELVLVMVIASTLLAVAAPKLGGWSRGAKLRNAGDEMLMLARLAQSEAITQGRIHRLQFDDVGGFWLEMQYGNEFVEVQTNFGKRYKLPEGIQMVLEKAGINSEYQNSAPDSIDFYPTGRTQPATITLTDSMDYQVVIACIAPADGFRWVEEVAP